MRAKFLLTLFLFTCILLFSTASVSAQMMGYYPTPSLNITLSPQDQEDIAEGQKLFQQIQNKQLQCSKLTSSDFDKIGEYVFEQQIGNPDQHAQMNQAMKQRMGDQGETNMHVSLGRRATGCITNNVVRGGVYPMMGWGSAGYGNMMYGNFGWGFGIAHAVIALIVVVDLILVGIWLWQQISSHKRR